MPAFDINEVINILLPILGGVWENILLVISYTWWIFLPLILFYILFDYWEAHVKSNYIKSIKWVVLELRIPKENLKGPKSMEQVFSSIHAMYSNGIKNWPDKYIKGKIEPSISFEIVGHSGGVYFYIKTPTDFRNLVESSIFSQYPDAEVNEVEDYVDQYPSILPNETWDLWGTDLILAKDEPYPIKTYSHIEDKDKRLDSLSLIMEIMSKVKGDDAIWLHFSMRATGSATNDYKDKGQSIINKLQGKEDKKPPAQMTFFDHVKQWTNNLIFGLVRPPEWGAPEVKKEEKPSKALSNIEREQIDGIESKLSKLAFEVVGRFVIIGKAGELNMSYSSLIFGALKQFGTENLNAFKPNGDTMTGGGKWWYSYILPNTNKRITYNKKRGLWDRAKSRVVGPKTSIMNVEELATIYHIPSDMVGAPRLRRLEAKKGEPPEGLPIEL